MSLDAVPPAVAKPLCAALGDRPGEEVEKISCEGFVVVYEAALQRIQIVKGWLAAGEPREQVYDVAGAPRGGADVDLATYPPRPRLRFPLHRLDRPGVRPDRACLLLRPRGREPSCRWNTWVCNARGVDCARPVSVPPELRRCCDPEVPKTIQERAWASPIGYVPRAGGRDAAQLGGSEGGAVR